MNSRKENNGKVGVEGWFEDSEVEIGAKFSISFETLLLLLLKSIQFDHRYTSLLNF